jgi:hypothetical protein
MYTGIDFLNIRAIKIQSINFSVLSIIHNNYWIYIKNITFKYDYYDL